VKASLDEIDSIELTQAELDRARISGNNYFIYRVRKLNSRKYPEGPEILIYENPYNSYNNISVTRVRIDLHGMKHTKVSIVSLETSL
jgi:hypothetical protein